jgi:hypothetical protein
LEAHDHTSRKTVVTKTRLSRAVGTRLALRSVGQNRAFERRVE